MSQPRVHLFAVRRSFVGEVRDAPVTEERDESLESLYEDLAGRLWRALFAYAGDRDVASDAVAEAFAQYLRRVRAVRSPARWIWRSAFRIAAGELKERRMTRSLPPVLPELPQQTGDLVSTLRLLPPKQRAAMILHYYAGYRTREIAEILGSTSATVRVHLSQGRRRLRRLLEEDND